MVVGKRVLLFIFLSAVSFSIFAEDLQLPAPQKTGGMPLMDALNARESNRRFSPRELELQKLSNLLWSGFGISANGRRTAPSAYNSQEIDLYVALSSGTFLYLPKEDLLQQVSEKDIREEVGGPATARIAPVHLIYVADYERMKGQFEFYAATDTGYVSQNVYLFCASVGLNTVVSGGAKHEALKTLLKLKPTQHVTLVQPVGYPQD
jgi:SagB-type dehydrogenase family enzyme